MKKFLKKCLILVLAISVLTGCGGNNKGGGSVNLQKLSESSYPIKTDVTLKYWLPGSAPVGEYKDKSQFPAYVKWQEKTGVKLEFVSPPLGQETQQFNIMLASGDLPDIINWYWGDYPGGPDKAIEEGYILKLNDILDKYSPAFAQILKADKYIDKHTKTDNGSYYYYPGLAQYGGEKDKLLITAGYMFRSDWLTELNLPIPETINDWYVTLKAFKEKKGADAPLCIAANVAGRGISGAFGVPFGWYLDNEEPKFGRVDPKFKDFLTEMNKWYNEGLLDKNFSNIDAKTVDSKLLNNKSGAVFGWLGSNMGKWLAAAKTTDKKFDLVGVPYPVMNKGDTPHFGTKDAVVYSMGPAISAKSKYKELAAKMLDYGYTKEGHNFANFGSEGESYIMENDVPKYSDLITKNPNGLTMEQSLNANIMATARGPYFQDINYIKQRYSLPQQQEAQTRWIKNDVEKYTMPRVTPTSAESSEFAKIMNDVTTYSDEMYLKFVMGKESLSKFDDYVAQIEKMGLKKAVEIQAAALARYNAR